MKKHANIAGAGIPYIKDIPDRLEAIHMPITIEDGPFGSSGASEAFQASGHCAVLNAIYNACGVRIHEIPALPAKIKAGLDAIAAGRENYTSAEDVATLLQLAYEGKLVSREASDLVMEALKGQADDEGVLNGLPEGTTFAHKTGALGTVQHDGGIVGGDNPYVLVVLCGGEGFSLQGAYDIMAATAKATWDILGEA